MSDEFFMRLAITEAWKYQGLTYPNPAVGAVVVTQEGAILAIAAHQRAAEAHAEVLALKEAYKVLSGDTAIETCYDAKAIHHYLHLHAKELFHHCTLYTTLEPCNHEGKTPSCAHLIQSLSLERVIIGTLDTHAVASGGARHLPASIGICEDACEALLLPFKAWQQRQCVVFKWAQRLSGTIDCGTISSLESRRYVHAMRDVCDLLVIGGHTVREDRPTLDSRLVKGKAPDILIYSHHQEFDQSIPLFQVQGREVFIDNTLSRLASYKNIIIEGGPALFRETQSLVTCYVSFTAPSSGGTVPFASEHVNFEFLHVAPSGDDITIWLRKKNE